MKTTVAPLLAAFTLGLTACATTLSGPAPSPAPGGTSPTTSAPARLDVAQAERLKRVMAPLNQASDHKRPLSQVKVGLIDDDHVNAASAGDGEFVVTTGLLKKANDQQLAGVLAHEIAHDDLGHVAKAERLQTGLTIGMVILDQIIPGSGQLTPAAGALITRAYSRKEEYEADAHGAQILERAGYPRTVMEDTLTWLLQTEGASGGGFFATHPATDDRIAALRNATH
jgi:predicted Zn-dependent protease